MAVCSRKLSVTKTTVLLLLILLQHISMVSVTSASDTTLVKCLKRRYSIDKQYEIPIDDYNHPKMSHKYSAMKRKCRSYVRAARSHFRQVGKLPDYYVYALKKVDLFKNNQTLLNQYIEHGRIPTSAFNQFSRFSSMRETLRISIFPVEL
ncbi:hypothetical protein LOK49_LG14G01778 [Camellia lanceoleosa]|uniref:Uncharacterized protein n=1 Tax=Camellia lanceoleosa TaxID=1840588 RepID=A0ACC0F9W1_9ERIC|nr:hypothetical protein LOK49_LG14G01778 [Camellia lanceoleosa]